MHPEQQRHRVLAGISRSRLLAVLRRSGQPMGVRELADAVDLHPNTAREHLDLLVGAGLITRTASAPNGRGRPGLRYVAEPAAAEADPEAYRALATVLTTELARMPDARNAAIRAGERWGQAVGTTDVSGPSASEAIGRLVQLLDDAGFAPEPSNDPAQPIRLRHCPFEPLAREHANVVCGVHLGLMRGALRAMGAPLDAVSLEPHVTPDLCLAHVEPTR
jgi:predicted ArsR family transcriptional regulator